MLETPKIIETKLNDNRNKPKESLLVTLDVKSLYTNIPNNEVIKAVRESYNKHPPKSVSTKVIITFLSQITLYSTSLTIYKFWVVQWAQFVIQHALIFLWHNLKQKIYTRRLMTKLFYF